MARRLGVLLLLLAPCVSRRAQAPARQASRPFVEPGVLPPSAEWGTSPARRPPARRRRLTEELCGDDRELLAGVLDALGVGRKTVVADVSDAVGDTGSAPSDEPGDPDPDQATVEAPRGDSGSGSRAKSGSGNVSEEIPRTGAHRTSRMRRPDRIGHFQIESGVHGRRAHVAHVTFRNEVESKRIVLACL